MRVSSIMQLEGIVEGLAHRVLHELWLLLTSATSMPSCASLVQSLVPAQDRVTEERGLAESRSLETPLV